VSSVESGLPPRFDVLAPELSKDPYPTYERLRERGALARAGPASWAVTRYAEVAALLRDKRLGHAVPDELAARVGLGSHMIDGTSAASAIVPVNPVLTGIVSSLDPPNHTRVRSLMVKALARTAAHQEEFFRAAADKLVAKVVTLCRFDAVADLARPLQLSFTSHLLGIPEADRDVVFQDAERLGRAIILLPFAERERGNGQQEARRLRSYFSGLVKERQRIPGADLISEMLTLRDPKRGPTLDEVIDNAAFFLFVGFETSICLIARSLAALARFPVEWARLRANREVAAGVIDEVLRYDAPLQWISRVTSEPIEIGGRSIKAGRLVLLLLGSANRDPRQFVNPNHLDLTRYPNPHLSFGGGTHHCMGAASVRTQTMVVLNYLIERCVSLRLGSEPVAVAHPNVRTYASVPIIVEPR
jgi:cytochrome P450